MSAGNVKGIYNPGELVFLQGTKVVDFFGVLEGRFAKVRSKSPLIRKNIKDALANATLVGIASRQEVFGEIEAFLDKPQSYSVFALDPGEVFRISTHDEKIKEVFGANPRYGVGICISFAIRLMEMLKLFTGFIKEEERLDQLLNASSRAYLSVITELQQIFQGNQDELVDFALRQAAYEESLHQISCEQPAAKSSSVFCAVIRPPTGDSRIHHFTPGTVICKRDTLGDRLFIVKEGVVEVLLGKGYTIQIARPGSIIGEIAVFQNLAAKIPNIKRTADVVCVTPVDALVLGLDEVEPFFAHNPDLMTNLLLAMVERTRETEILLGLAKTRIREKIFSLGKTLLECHNNLAHEIEKRSDNLALSRPLDFVVNQTQLLYNKFSELLKQMPS